VSSPSRDNPRLPTRTPAAPLLRRGVASARTALSPIERDANTTAMDWQIVLQLKMLFERDPTLISLLMEDSTGKHAAAHAGTLLAAVREALAACPDRADLHYQAAKAAARHGQRQDAEALLRRAVELAPSDRDVPLLLDDLRAGPDGADSPRAEGASLPDVVSPDTAVRKNDRRGNELPA